MIITGIIVILMIVILAIWPFYRHQRRNAHDLRQLIIYNNVVDRLVKQSIAGDIPRDEALIILNAAKATYNESVQKYKNIQQTSFPEVHLDEAVGDNPRNKTSSEGEKSERKKPDRSTRPSLDSNPQS